MKPLDGKKIIITGGLGFIGSNIAAECVRRGAVVTVYDISDPDSGANLYNIHDIHSQINLIRADIRDSAKIREALRGQEILFNCAAHTSHPGSMQEPLKDIDINCKGVITVLEAIRYTNPQIKIVHAGTTTQIGKMRQTPVDEMHPEFPTDMYSANKTVSEKYVLLYGNAYGIQTTVLRLANVFGPRSNIRSSDFGFINYFIGLALQNKEITIYGEGTQKRSLLYIKDAVEAMITAAILPQSNGEVFFINMDKQYSVNQIAAEITQYIGGSVKHIPWPHEREIIEIGDAIISNKKAKRILRWEPRYDLSSGLEETGAYFKNCLSEYV